MSNRTVPSSPGARACAPTCILMSGRQVRRLAPRTPASLRSSRGRGPGIPQPTPRRTPRACGCRRRTR
ncbi:MAG: hypothetical protein EDS66_16470 [Planctomycetota bacterium]|nr:MAG: hypothetical protein EDS66_16470 [Planctomycetota bacterium]KAB2939920.1 MAG: hypothetical protein F9K17_14520 [Phycisphaerae bacterium]MCQ3922527.1 hypothetical protein [Planctomycetota bacterium]